MDLVIDRRCLLIGLLLLAALPTAAQNADPFRSPSPSTPVSPSPSAPPPAQRGPSSLPPAPQIWANVRQVAQARGILVPLAGNPVFDESGTSPQYRGLLGAWGPGTWQNDPLSEKMILIVQSVDAGGNARGVVGRSSSDGWFPFAAQIVSNRLVVEAPITRQARMYATRTETDNWAFEIRPDGSLLGSRNGNANSILLTRLQ